MSRTSAASQIRAGAGQAVAHSPEDAARLAAQGALKAAGSAKADLAFVFCADPDVDDAGQLSRIVSEATGGAKVIGCSAVSVIAGNDELEGDPAIAVLVVDGMRARALLVDDDDPTATARDIEQLGQPASDDNALLLALADPAAFHPAVLPYIDRMYPGVPVIGGGAAGHRTFVMAEGAASSRGTAFAMLSSPSAPLIAVSQGCRPFAPNLTITRAQGNLILEIDNRPAYEVFKELVGDTLMGDPEEVSSVVFAALGCGETLAEGYVVRGLVGFEPQMGIIAVGDRVHDGQPMTFALREGNAAREEHDRTLAHLARRLEGRKPAFGLYFDCAGRGRSLYGFPGIDVAYIRRHLGEFPLAGMFSAFELAPLSGINEVHMFSGVLAVWPEN